MKWHLAILSVIALALGACGDTQTQQRAIQVFLDEPAPASVSGQFPRFQPLLAAGQGPALQVSIPSKNLTGGFLQEAQRGPIESWLGNDGVGLTFDRGILHGTRGIGVGLLASDVSQTAKAVLSGSPATVSRVHTYLDGNDQTETRTYTCTIANDGRDTIPLDIGATATRRMTETCRGADQQFTNTYWVDPRRNRIVQSRQWSGDFAGELVITTVYKF